MPQPATTLPTLMTVDEVAKVLRITPAAVRQRARRGDIPGRMMLGPQTLRFDAQVFAEWLASCTEGASEGER